MLDKIAKVSYWTRAAENDWRVVGHLFEKGDYPYALFFAHLTLEKTLKALIILNTGGTPPLTHRLVYLAEKTKIPFSEEHIELLEIVTDFNLEARCPDENFSFQARCTNEFTRNHLNRIEELKKWLQKKLPSSEI